jgi:hydroxyquinol 1,2-dioxygenase
MNAVWSSKDFEGKNMTRFDDQEFTAEVMRSWCFSFRTIPPCSYPIPIDGPVGELIAATDRQPMRPAHVHFLVKAQGYEPLITHVFLEGDQCLTSDAVFGVKDELVSRVEHHDEPVMPDGGRASGPWHVMTYDFQMKPGTGVVPQPLM